MRKHLILLLIFSFILTSCNSEVAQLSPISKIAATFNTGNYSNFDGGVMVVGIRKDAPGRVQYAFEDGRNNTFSFNRGDWDFYAIGYEGTSYVENGVTKYHNFQGTYSCAYSNVKIRGGSSTTINLNLTPSGCTGKFLFDTKPETFVVQPCSAFYYYDPATDTFNPRTSYDVSTCTNIPEEQSGGVYYYRLAALKTSGNSFSEGFKSRCLVTPVLGNEPLALPTKVFPLKVKLYRSLDLCNADTYNHVSYDFINGIETGNPEQFDHKFDTTAARLILPDNHVRRYTSPFMNMLPRFLCGGNDCFVQPNLQGRTVTVPWSTPLKNQLLMTDPVENSCENLTNYSRYFGISECQIKNKFLYATINRNYLTCVDSTAATVTYKDIYERNGFAYVLHSTGTTTHVSILTDEGRYLTVLTVDPAITTYEAITASDNGDIFVSDPSQQVIRKYQKTSSGTYILEHTATTISASYIEVTPDGNYLLIGKPGSSIISALETENYTEVSNLDLGATVRKIQVYNGKVYAMALDVPGTDILQIKRLNFTNEIFNPEETFTSSLSTNFHINSGLLYLIGSGDGGPRSIISSRNFENGQPVTVNGLSGNSAFQGDIDRFIIIRGLGLGLLNGTNDFYNIKWNGGEWDNSPSPVDSCTDTFKLTLGNQLKINYTFSTSKVQDEIATNSQIFEGAYKMVGRRYLYPDISSSFKSLNNDQSRKTSGGELSRVQRILGPQGLGGMLSEYSDCNRLAAAVFSTGIDKTVAVTDPYRGYRSYRIKIMPNSDSIPSFICNDSIINDGGCADTFEMSARVKSTGLFETDIYRLKLKCDAKTGQFGYQAVNADETITEQYYWNTNDVSAARYDTYKTLESPEYSNYQVTVVTQSGDNIRGRNINWQDWDNWTHAFVLDYQRNSSQHSIRYSSAEGTDTTFNGIYSAIRSQADYSGAATACMTNYDDDTSQSVDNSCNLTDLATPNSKNAPMSLSTLENPFSFKTLFTTFP